MSLILTLKRTHRRVKQQQCESHRLARGDMDKHGDGHAGKSSRINQASGQTLRSTKKAREAKQRGARAMRKGKYWKLHQRRCNQPYIGIHKQLPQRGRQMKRARWRESGGTAMGIITRFICNIPVCSSYHRISPFLRGLSLRSFLFRFAIGRRKAESAKSSLSCIPVSSVLFFFFFLFFV